MTPGRYALAFTQGETTVTVHTGCFPMIGHLANYLHYTTDPAAPAGSDWRVAAHLAPLPALPPLPTALAGEYGDPAAMVEVGHGRLLHHQRTGSLTAIDPVRRRLTIRNPDPRGLFIDTYKAVRQLLTSAAIGQGMVVVHASALTIAGQTVVFAGPAGAGKTTMLAATLAAGGRAGALLGNDRIFLHASGDGVGVCGWPTVTGLGYGTLTALPHLAARLSHALHDRAGGTARWLLDQPLLPDRATDLIPGEVRADPTGPAARREKVWLTPQELAVATRSTTGASGRLALLVAPSIDPAQMTPRAEPMGSEAAAALLHANRHPSAWQDHPNWLGLPWHPNPGLSDVLAWLVKPPGIPAVKLVVGSDPARAARMVLEVLTDGQWSTSGR